MQLQLNEQFHGIRRRAARRRMTLTILAAGIAALVVFVPLAAAQTFTDVPTSHPFYNQIERAYAAGMIGACAGSPPPPNQTFCPGNFITKGSASNQYDKAFGLDGTPRPFTPTWRNINIITGGSIAPFTVDSQVKVTNLNADLLDGLDSAAFATRADLSTPGTINNPSNPLDWTKLKNVPAGFADGTDDGGAGAGWSLSGNAGTDPSSNYLGTSDNQPLNFKVDGIRALRLEPFNDPSLGDAPNVIGGAASNSVDAGLGAATIAGGIANSVSGGYGSVGGGISNAASGLGAAIGGGAGNSAGQYGTVAGGISNTAFGQYAAVGGGQSNHASGLDPTVGGGQTNTAGGDWSTVSGGWTNTAGSQYSTVGGGRQNSAGGDSSTVAGGITNTAAGAGAMVPGGQANDATGFLSFAAGRRAKAVDLGSFVWGDSNNFDFSSTGANSFNVRSVGGARFVTSIDSTGTATSQVKMPATGGLESFKAGADQTANFSTALYGEAQGGVAVAGIVDNGGVGGDFESQVGVGVDGTTGESGGQSCDAALRGTIRGVGYPCDLQGTAGVLAVAGDGPGARAESKHGDGVDASATASGKSGIYAHYDGPSSCGNTGTVPCGWAGYFGGNVNVNGGLRVAATGTGFGSGLDVGNDGLDASSTHGDGAYAETTSGSACSAGVRGVQGATGFFCGPGPAGVVGQSDSGFGVQAASGNSVGLSAYSGGDDAIHTQTGAGTTSAKKSAIYAQYYGCGGCGYAGYFSGDVTVTGTLNYGSDRVTKANFRAVDAGTVLQRLAGLPIETWNYKTEPTKVRHIGPMAQEFYAAFHVGTDKKHISTVDAEGVNMAATQALYKLVEKQQKQIDVLQKQVRALRRH